MSKKYGKHKMSHDSKKVSWYQNGSFCDGWMASVGMIEILIFFVQLQCTCTLLLQLYHSAVLEF